MTAGRRCGRLWCCGCRHFHEAVLTLVMRDAASMPTATSTAIDRCLNIARTLPTTVQVAKSGSGGETAAAAALWCCPGHGTLGRREHHATRHHRGRQ